MSFSVRGQNVTVAGAARSGIAAALLLAERGARVTLTDARSELEPSESNQLRDARVALELGAHRLETFTSADLLVVSPGVPLDQPQIAAAREAGVPIMGEIELASRWLTGRIVAITGTKGKSTTTTLTGRMFTAGGLTAVVGGNIGTPLSSQVAASTPETFHIVEVSSFQLETTETFHPWIAVLLNLSSDHLDRHGSMEAYGAAKAKIFANQTPDDWAVINADDPQTLALARAGRAQESVFLGRHAAGAAVVDTADRPAPRRRRDGRRDRGADRRCADRRDGSSGRIVHGPRACAGAGRRRRRRRFVNDSKATNVEAAQRAIESFEPGLVVIMGGRFKSGDFSLLRDPLRSRDAKVVAIGEATPLIERALDGAVPVEAAATLEAAVRRAYELARAQGSGGVVLLAPACASFDMFRDYAERGQVFKKEVLRLRRRARASGEQSSVGLVR